MMSNHTNPPLPAGRGRRQHRGRRGGPNGRKPQPARQAAAPVLWTTSNLSVKNTFIQFDSREGFETGKARRSRSCPPVKGGCGGEVEVLPQRPMVACTPPGMVSSFKAAERYATVEPIYAEMPSPSWVQHPDHMVVPVTMLPAPYVWPYAPFYPPPPMEPPMMYAMAPAGYHLGYDPKFEDHGAQLMSFPTCDTMATMGSFGGWIDSESMSGGLNAAAPEFVPLVHPDENEFCGQHGMP